MRHQKEGYHSRGDWCQGDHTGQVQAAVGRRKQYRQQPPLIRRVIFIRAIINSNSKKYQASCPRGHHLRARELLSKSRSRPRLESRSLRSRSRSPRPLSSLRTLSRLRLRLRPMLLTVALKQERNEVCMQVELTARPSVLCSSSFSPEIFYVLISKPL